MKIFFSKECLQYEQHGHPESPLRLSAAYHYLREKKYQFIIPGPCTREDVLLAHSEALLASVEKGDFSEVDTPVLPNICRYAMLAAGSAIEAALWSLKGEYAFSLMRPPGHHATRDQTGGFCYFNNIAIAVLRAKERVAKIAIIDLDGHHGNGTEDIVLGREGIIYVSLHQGGLFPGTGMTSQKNCYNYPLAAGVNWDEYGFVLRQALDVVEQFNPDLVAVSIGFDTYIEDPLTELCLIKVAYRYIAAMLAGLNKPMFAVLEGGYHTEDLPECINEFLEVFLMKSK